MECQKLLARLREGCNRLKRIPKIGEDMAQIFLV